MSATAGSRERWFFGPLPDLLLGCGVLYFAFFAAQAAAGPQLRALLPLSLLPLLTLVLGAPHYGATLLRVYATRESRHRYFVFAWGVTLLLAVAYVVGLHVLLVGSLLVTLYLTWSPWHYTAQNYGVAALFLRRRGVPLDDTARRLLRASFVLSYLMVFLAIHSPTPSPDYAPASYKGSLFDFLSLGIPSAVHVPATLAVELAYLLSLCGFGWVIAPRAALRELAPVGLLILAQALWFAVPTIAVQWGAFQGVEPLRYEQRAYAFMWIAVGHFVQYLWITTWFAAERAPRAAQLRQLAKALLAGSALWVAPTLIFAPGAFGTLSHTQGLALLTAAVVNLHHFILDGVIWKLRDGWVQRWLLRPPETLHSAASPRVGAHRPRSLAPAVWVLGAACFALAIGLKFDLWSAERAAARGDLDRLRAAYDRRAWLGRDSANVRLRLAQRALRAGQPEQARRDLERAGALAPDDPRVQAALARLAGDTEH